MLEHYNTTASVKAVADYLGDINVYKDIMPEMEIVKQVELHDSNNALTYYMKVGTSVILKLKMTKLLKGTWNEKERLLFVEN
jgi:hypothetical protein